MIARLGTRQVGSDAAAMVAHSWQEELCDVDRLATSIPFHRPRRPLAAHETHPFDSQPLDHITKEFGMSAIRNYANAVNRDLAGFLPAQPFGSSARIGDLYSISWFNKSRVDKVGTVFNFGAPQPALVSTQDKEKISLQSEKGVKVTGKLKGTPPQPGSGLEIGQAGLTIEFTSDSSFLFEGVRLRYTDPQDIPAFRASAVKALSAVPKDALASSSSLWLVTRIAEVDRYTLALASSSGAVFEVAASASASLAAQDLASAELDLSIARSEKLQYHVLGAAGAGVFFHAMKIAVEFQDALRTKAFAPSPAAGEAELEALGASDVDLFVDYLEHAVGGAN
ncbi:hypothetical protein GGR77_002732 [Xanthomonas translucens]